MKHRSILAVVALLALVALGSGCGFRLNFTGAFPKTAVVPPGGLIYTKFSAPLTTSFDNTPVESAKYAELQTKYIYIPFLGGFSFGWGDVSLQSMAKEKGLSKINYADYDVMNILTIYSVTTFRLYGE